MALYDQTYQPWNGTLQSRPSRILALFTAGFGQVWKRRSVKVILILLLAIITVWIGILLLQAVSKMPPLWAKGNAIYREQFFDNPFFHSLLMALAAIAGGGLISLDRKHRAFSMYFSKAIGKTDYVLARYLTLAAYLALGTALPAFALWIGQVSIATAPIKAAEHFADLGAILLHSLIICIPTAAIVLALSAGSTTLYIPAISWMLLYEGSALLAESLSEELVAPELRLVSFRALTTELGEFFYQRRDEGLAAGFLERAHSTSGVAPAIIALILVGLTALSITTVFLRLRVTETRE